MIFEIPKAVEELLCCLKGKGFDVWIVGGAVRDLFMGKEPKDWDVATNAPLEELLNLPYRVVPIGKRFGVVDVILDNLTVEVTSIVKSTVEGTIEADLSRRDFTVNAMAISFERGSLIDPYNGLRDLEKKVLRGVVSPKERFVEDPLRIIRAARFVSVYGFSVLPDTYKAMVETSPLLSRVAMERIREEFFKLLVGSNVMEGLDLLRKSKGFNIFFPEILEGWRKKQNEFHRFHIYRHIIETVANTEPRLRLRLAALFHDIAKPRVRTKQGKRYRFFGHEVASEELSVEIMKRWKVSQKLMSQVAVLVRNHMVSNLDKWSDGAIRRLILRVGEDLLEDFIELLKADRLAHGVDRGDLQEIERLMERIEKVKKKEQENPFRVLAINGHDVMKVLNLSPGPAVGAVLRYLHQHVTEHPEDNQRDKLIRIILEKISSSKEEISDGLGN